ncbi:MAG TPA: prepilin-type N-terminal cleavage/methylation domain-containing protein [Verrucomicrobiae bacterium]
MKIRVLRNSHKGFTLIEMIGVLAVIAILAAVLIPKVFEAINSSRVNNAAMSCQTMKTAIIDHYAKYNTLLWDGGAATPAAITLTAGAYNNYDKLLLGEQLVDKALATKISDPTDVGTKGAAAVTGTRVDLLDMPAATITVGATVVVASESPTFDLDGTGGNDVTGSLCSIAVLPNVAIADARDLSARIDGDQLSNAPGVTTEDLVGRVKYATADAGSTTVYVYLTHR